MATDAVVVMAYRDMGVEERRKSFNHVVPTYAAMGLQVVVNGGDSDDTFTRATALNAAIESTTARIIVQSDPDCLVPEAHLRQGIALAAERDGLVLPHDRWLYLHAAATDRVLSGARTIGTLGPEDCVHHGDMGCGGVVVFSRNTWEVAGRYDERFGLWGGDDAALIYAADAFTGQPTRRVTGPLLHLWHPPLPQSNPEHPTYVEQFAILSEYVSASKLGRAAVRAVVATR